jgi:serine/threonine protein kinase
MLSIQHNGHIKLVDFGFSKFLREPLILDKFSPEEKNLF